mmetsp:Transcript_7614/g.16509  ORF Transcript_7614/g.16509 Transcript_7614/m.16509 type:complete len:221 (+) Transcript_7614:1149-1811(+)
MGHLCMYSVLPLPSPLCNQALQHARLSEGAHIPNLFFLTSGNLPQYTAHDLARARLGQRRSPVDDFGHCKGANGLAHVLHQGRAHGVIVAAAVLERHVRVDCLALDCMVDPNDCRLCTLVVLRQGALHLRGAYAVAAHVDHVIHTACDPDVTVLVTPATITREVVALEWGKVDRGEALVVSMQGAGHGGPGPLDGEDALPWAAHLLPLGAQQHGLNPKEG